MPCTAGFDPACAGGYLPGGSALPEGYCVLTLDIGFPFFKVLAQNPISVPRTRQECSHHTTVDGDDKRLERVKDLAHQPQPVVVHDGLDVPICIAPLAQQVSYLRQIRN